MALWPADLPPLEGLRLTGPVLGLSSLLALGAVVLVGLVPAREAARTDVVAGLRASGRSPQAGREAHRARGIIVVAEVALAVVLVSGAGLLLNSVWRLEQAPLGFRAEGATSARLSLPRSLSADAPALRLFATGLEERLRGLPGVVAAGLGQQVAALGQRHQRRPPGRGPGMGSNEQVDTAWRLVTPTWFGALGVPVLKGRAFDAARYHGERAGGGGQRHPGQAGLRHRGSPRPPHRDRPRRSPGDLGRHRGRRGRHAPGGRGQRGEARDVPALFPGLRMGPSSLVAIVRSAGEHEPLVLGPRPGGGRAPPATWP